MNSKKILLISKITFLSLTFLVAGGIVYASEISGVLSSSGGNSATVVGGTTVTGSFGGGSGGSTVGSTVSGTVTGGGNGPISGSSGGGNSSGFVATNSQGGSQIPVTSFVSTDGLTNGAIAVGLTDGGNTAVGNTGATVADAQNPNNPNTNQLAAAVASGVGFGSWIWWVIALMLIIVISYYTYNRYEKRRSIR